MVMKRKDLVPGQKVEITTGKHFGVHTILSVREDVYNEHNAVRLRDPEGKTTFRSVHSMLGTWNVVEPKPDLPKVGSKWKTQIGIYTYTVTRVYRLEHGWQVEYVSDHSKGVLNTDTLAAFLADMMPVVEPDLPNPELWAKVVEAMRVVRAAEQQQTDLRLAWEQAKRVAYDAREAYDTFDMRAERVVYEDALRAYEAALK